MADLHVLSKDGKLFAIFVTNHVMPLLKVLQALPALAVMYDRLDCGIGSCPRLDGMYESLAPVAQHMIPCRVRCARKGDLSRSTVDMLSQ